MCVDLSDWDLCAPYRRSLAISGPQQVRSIKNVEKDEENNRGLWRRYMSARDTHQTQKRGSFKPLFTSSICACEYSVLSQADKWPPLITSAPSIYLLLTVPPVPVIFSSPTTCATSLHITSIPLHLISYLCGPHAILSLLIHPQVSTWPSLIHYSIPSVPITSLAATSVIRLPRKHPAQTQMV